MARFVELPTVGMNKSAVWLNPDHVVSVTDHYRDAQTCWLTTPMGERHHVDLSVASVMELLTTLDLRDSVRENLTR